MPLSANTTGSVTFSDWTASGILSIEWRGKLTSVGNQVMKTLLSVALNNKNRRSPPKKKECRDTIRPYDAEYKKHLIKLFSDSTEK